MNVNISCDCDCDTAIDPNQSQSAGQMATMYIVHAYVDRFVSLTSNDNKVVLFYSLFHRFAIALVHISCLAPIDVAAEISIILCTHRMFVRNMLAIVDGRIVVGLCNQVND